MESKFSHDLSHHKLALTGNSLKLIVAGFSTNYHKQLPIGQHVEELSCFKSRIHTCLVDNPCYSIKVPPIT